MSTVADLLGFCSLKDEFSKKEMKKWFWRQEKKVLPHIDTLYYSVSIFADCPDNNDKGVFRLLRDLAELKQQKLAAMQLDVEFCGLSVMSTGFSIYQYRLCMNETFDIFIASSIPNGDTPRIVVQLRSRALVLDGPSKAILDSFKYVKMILNTYGLEVGKVRENRIDYAYHINTIQNPYLFFSDEELLKSLKTKMRLGTKVFEFGKDIRLTYLSLGNKKSNNVFFRCYDKTEEVVEKNYKPFFIDRWLENHLISEYDAYVLRVAFGMKSYRTGLLIGRIDWYLEFGKNEARKEFLLQVRKTAYEESDNIDYLEKQVKKILPPVTTILNVEFQTKRAFYQTFDPYLNNIVYEYSGDPVLTRLMKLLSCRSVLLEYLTGVCVKFVKNRDAPKSEMCDWWNRIHTCRHEFSPKASLEAWREYDRQAELQRSQNRLLNSLAHFNIVRSKSLAPSTFHEDISDALCALNDNDFYGFATDPDGKDVQLASRGYAEIQHRKARQYRGIIKEDPLNEEVPEEVG